MQAIPPELQSDYAPAAGAGSDKLGFLPGARPSPVINLPPVLPDLEHFAASSVSGCASAAAQPSIMSNLSGWANLLAVPPTQQPTAPPCCPSLTECALGRRSHSLWSRRSSSSGVTARRRTSLPVPGAPQLPPHPESPPAPVARPPRPEQPPAAAAHPADVVPDAVADTDSAAMTANSTQPAEPGDGVSRQQASQASPTAGHGPEAHSRDSATSAAAEHDGALPETAQNAEPPALGASPPRVPPLRLGSLGGGAARQPQPIPRWVELTLLSRYP